MTETTPALTDAEWKEVLHEITRVVHPESMDADVPLIDRAMRWIRPRKHDTRADAFMAVANATLPDSHPGKLTWADVEALKEMDDRTDGMWDAGPVSAGWQSKELQHLKATIVALAAKLAALLPPQAAPPGEGAGG